MLPKCVTRFACATALLVSPWLTGMSHSQTITLGAALHRALAASPRLTAAERDIGIATGQRIQAGALLNPELSYEQDNSFGSGIYRGTKSAETTLQISQLFELWGKREARIAAGQAGLDAATIERQAVRLQVLSETAIAFLSVLGLQRRIQILDDQVAAIRWLAAQPGGPAKILVIAEDWSWRGWPRRAASSSASSPGTATRSS